MRRRYLVLVFTAFVFVAGTGLGAALDWPVRVLAGHDHLLVGGVASPGKAGRDTTYLLGGPGRTDGNFEQGWNGWTSVDFTRPDVPDGGYWRVSTFHAAGLNGHPEGNRAYWCGTYFDDDPGYGNDWRAILEWDGPALSVGQSRTLRVTGWLNHDVEAGFDFVRLQTWRGGVWETLISYDGEGTNLAVDQTTVVGYTGPDSALRLRWSFESDAMYSDEDGQIDTDGACQIDDLTVRVDNQVVAFDDFEEGSPVHWYEPQITGVGDFAARYLYLLDLDPCRANTSYQVAFVDDGVVVPGTGGSPCISWCYGPGGWIVNNTGGLLGPDFHLDNGIVSPPVALPAGSDGVDIAFDVYDAEHSWIPASDAGVFHTWRVRSTASGDPADLAAAAWRDRGILYQGRSVYERGGGPVADLLVPGACWLQLCLEVREWGYLFGLEGNDGHPAPYFDNVAIRVYPHAGPHVVASAVDLAQDTFPAAGFLDPDDLAANSCRFDMARTISPASHLRNDPGDSLVITVTPRSGAALVGAPRLLVSLRPNPLFAAVRTLPPGFSVTPAGLVKGTVTGWLCDAADSRYAFDLPDTGFFYPGDRIHYFFEATDQRAGELGLTRLPADTAGFDRFTGAQAIATPFAPEFQVRALPTMFSANEGDQPRILFWDDSGNRDEAVRWLYALADGGYAYGVEFDAYRTQAATSGVGNGLGGRATASMLAGYDILLYTCGDLAQSTLANGDFLADPSPDLQVLTAWFELGDKNALLTGDDLVSSLLASGFAGASFVSTYLGVDLVDAAVRPYIGNQVAPLVRTIPGNNVIVAPDRWIAYGGCPIINRFDALVVSGGGIRLAEFTDTGGDAGVFPYTAATYCRHVASNTRVVSLPYGFQTLQNAPGWTPPLGLPARVRSLVLRDLLWFFGAIGGAPIAAPDAGTAFTASACPNPFNPRTVIRLDLSAPADVRVRIYDLRGALVRTLGGGRLAAGRHEFTWTGKDDRGAALASGVYFYEAKAGDATRLGKLMLIR